MQFSVIIPTYNRQKEIDISIKSVLAQTFNDFELIVVDNGSTDNTKSVVEKYINIDSRVKYIWQENTGSPAGSRNTGIKNAIGQWVAFLDSDDYWYGNKLESVFNIIKKHQDIIAVSHYEDKMIDGKHNSILYHGDDLDNNNMYYQLLFKGNNLSTSAMVVRKDKLIEVGCFDERMDYFAVEDYDLWMRLSKLGKFYFIKEILGAFCISSNNMSGHIELINNNLKTLVLNHIDELDILNKQKLKKKHAARIDYYKGRAYQISGNRKKAIKFLFNSIKDYPFSLKKYISLLFAIFNIRK
ncbi:glycosyltransferase family 2 protein [Campylobacter hyointestinalis]|uniref:Glycosyl transferase n=1 Tax=Campylobacter hyointestinalis subsp. hyointestinalis TaxID=91352 RepID=A0A855N7Q9_CAMHY|nr:glycosyltransferase family A protein [Campylobacter hyointestinalis]PPB57882.1 glycosyl transferase [Campylobacter hyointestinalis subsp. hyointestinalis]PPB64412.1 glycosyl transferase [Campylobacter hyointestinalis subsp. hyointestinalis]PPB72149.1 glycosyl transferase [Campylobacter hyointestinalis subsp. hyointestinalis]QKF54940.1 glycosyltransferase, family 2 [Campylobacter hyointestinalis subsp. hyointestinalis]TXK47823.1 glycosyltransferase family 2 protein [Campylobacter hyointestin